MQTSTSDRNIKKQIPKFGNWEYFEKYNLIYVWKKFLNHNIFTQVLYRMTPFAATLFIYWLMMKEGVLFMGKDEFSFLYDTSNSFCMVRLFFCPII